MSRGEGRLGEWAWVDGSRGAAYHAAIACRLAFVIVCAFLQLVLSIGAQPAHCVYAPSSATTHALLSALKVAFSSPCSLVNVAP